VILDSNPDVRISPHLDPDVCWIAWASVKFRKNRLVTVYEKC